MPSKLLGFTPNTAPSDQDMRRMAHAGASTIRYQLSWSVLQRRHAPINWSSADHFIERASRAGLSLDLLLGTTPVWARPTPDTYRWSPPMASETEKAAWEHFVKGAAMRYGHNGLFWQEHPELTYRPVTWTIWNEPNLPRYWGGPPTPAVFARLVELTSAALRSEDPQGTVVTGGLFCQGPWKSFLAQFYADVNHSAFDGIALHPYSERPFGVNRLVLGARQIMTRVGDADAQTWIDEISWGTDVSQHRFTYPPKQQARRMRILFQALAEERHELNLGKVMWYGIRDDPASNICHFCATSGLWFEGGTKPKPAWFVYKTFGTKPASGIRGRVTRGRHHPVGGQTVYVDLNDNGSHQAGEPEVTSNGRGRFHFGRLFPTKYVVRLIPSETHACKRPAHCVRKLKVVSGKTRRHQHFFVRPRPRTVFTKSAVGRHKASFKFRALRGRRPYRFKCKLDNRHYHRCRSPKRYSRLSPGEHKLRVRAKDSRGTVEKIPAKKTFDVKG